MGADYRNGSGYYDPTVAQMLKADDEKKKQDKRDRDVKNLIAKCLSELSKNNITALERFTLRDNKTGKVYK